MITYNSNFNKKKTYIDNNHLKVLLKSNEIHDTQPMNNVWGHLIASLSIALT